MGRQPDHQSDRSQQNRLGDARTWILNTNGVRRGTYRLWYCLK
jgi:hypothetical protein